MENKYEYPTIEKVKVAKSNDSPFVAAAGLVVGVGMIVLRFIGHGLKASTRLLLQTNLNQKRPTITPIPSNRPLTNEQLLPPADPLIDSNRPSSDQTTIQ